MELKLSISGKNCTINTAECIDISIPMNFNGHQPNSYNARQASSEPYRAGSLVGDTRQGGSCNFEVYKLIPHCNGTHTECVGHISDERISINDTLKNYFIPALLITVQPVSPSQTLETYDPSLNPEDNVITHAALSNAITGCNNDFLKALVIRTLPNDDSKQSRKYMDNPPPFFSIEAMKFISDSGVQHLLVDIPSVDRTFDDGKLVNHHIFWDVEQGSHVADKDSHSLKTITEMIYVPVSAPDGEYILNLQTAPFVSDAAPSRPVLYKIKFKEN